MDVSSLSVASVLTFEYTKTLMYSKDAVRIAQDLICEGADIVTDTNMALAGINKKALAIKKNK